MGEHKRVAVIAVPSAVVYDYYKKYGKGEVKMNRKKPLKSKRKGSSMVLVTLAVVILLLLGGGLLSLSMHGQLQTIRANSEIAARSAADAGLAKALFEIGEKLKVNPGDISALRDAANPQEVPALLQTTAELLPNCDASFSYKITAASVHSISGKQGLTVESVGRCGRSVKKVYATVVLKGLFDNAILVQDRISLMPNTLVKGYNSADSADTDIDVKIGTTSTSADRIPLGPGTVIDGDVFVGVGGDPAAVIGAGGTITGEKYALLQEIEFPVITPPPLTDVGTSLYAKGATITMTPIKNGKYTEINLAQAAGSSGILEILGGNVVLHITGNINLGTGCEIVVDPGSSLTLYVDGDIDASNSGGLNNTSGNIADFKLYGTSEGEQTFILRAKSDIFGLIYAPNAEIQLYPSSELHGAITGKSVLMKSGCTFYYDEALKDPSVYDAGVRFVVDRWSEE